MMTFRDQNDYTGIKLPEGFQKAMRDPNKTAGGLAAAFILAEHAVQGGATPESAYANLEGVQVDARQTGAAAELILATGQ